LTGKCFPLTNFSGGKQTHENLKSDFPKSEFQKTNIALKNIIYNKLGNNSPMVD
jgi:hypothetical protein